VGVWELVAEAPKQRLCREPFLLVREFDDAADVSICNAGDGSIADLALSTLLLLLPSPTAANWEKKD
jgi:hypothetical protein